MLELSIAVSLVQVAEEAAAHHGGGRVTRVFVKVGALSGVVPRALAFAFDVAAAETNLAGAALEIEEVPVVVFCGRCGAEKTLPDDLAFHCPDCAGVAVELRSGRELEIAALEIADDT
jgi:hydrogenase nickel incorporation protein HypA/HybF